MISRTASPALGALLLTLLSGQAGASAVSESSAPASELAGHLLQMLVGLGIVIALLIACLWLIRHLSAPRGSAAHALKVLGATALGPRERVVLVRVADEVLVLGVAPGRISTLHRLPATALQDALLVEAAEGSKGAGGSFASWLSKAKARHRQPTGNHHAP